MVREMKHDEDFCYKCGEVGVYWDGFHSDISSLARSGWFINAEYNRYARKWYVSFRNPRTGVVSGYSFKGYQGTFQDIPHAIYLDYMTSEKNQRIKPKPVFIDKIEAVFEQYDIPDLMRIILNLQSKYKKTKKKTADVIKFKERA